MLSMRSVFTLLSVCAAFVAGCAADDGEPFEEIDSAPKKDGGTQDAAQQADVNQQDAASENHAPKFDDATRHIRVISGCIGKPLSVTLHATDADGDRIEYGMSENAPDGSALDKDTGVFTWTPAQEFEGNAIFGVTDGQDQDTLTVSVNIADCGEETDGGIQVINTPPSLTSIGEITVEPGKEYSLSVSATDRDGDILEYSIQDSPDFPGEVQTYFAGYRFEGNVFKWTPQAAHADRTVHCLFVVSDKPSKPDNYKEVSTLATFKIAKLGEPVNHAPTLDAINAGEKKDLRVEESWTFTAQGHDEDGDALTYSITNAPATAQMNATTGVFSYTAVESDVGLYEMTVTVKDAKGLTATRFVTMEVLPKSVGPVTQNQAPVLNSIGNKEVTVGQTLSFTVSATDPDNDTLTYSFTPQFANATINSQSGAFSFTPAQNQVGSQRVTFSVSDGHNHVDSEQIDIAINAAAIENRAPSLSAISNQTISQTGSLSLQVSASDPDGDNLTYSISGDAPATISTNGGLITWTTSCNTNPGTYDQTVTVSDGHGHTATQNFTITVTSNSSCSGPVGCGYTGTTGDSLDFDDCNHDSAHASPVADALLLTSLNLVPGYSDWFKFDATSGHAYTIAITFQHDRGDLELALFKPDGTTQSDGCKAYTGTSGTCGSARASDFETLNFKAPSTGTYYIKVYGNGSTVGNDNYQLYFSEHIGSSSCYPDRAEDTGGDSNLAAGTNDFVEKAYTLNEYNQWYTWLSLCGDEDWFKVTVPASAATTASITIPPTADAVITAYKQVTVGGKTRYQAVGWPYTPAGGTTISQRCADSSNTTGPCRCAGKTICDHISNKQSNRTQAVAVDIPASSSQQVYYLFVQTNTPNVLYDLAVDKTN